VQWYELVHKQPSLLTAVKNVYASYTLSDKQPSLLIAVQYVYWHACLVIVELHSRFQGMVTPGDENIPCTPELSP
jgi:hypothetical protein